MELTILTKVVPIDFQGRGTVLSFSIRSIGKATTMKLVFALIQLVLVLPASAFIRQDFGECTPIAEEVANCHSRHGVSATQSDQCLDCLWIGFESAEDVDTSESCKKYGEEFCGNFISCMRENDCTVKDKCYYEYRSLRECGPQVLTREAGGDCEIAYCNSKGQATLGNYGPWGSGSDYEMQGGAETGASSANGAVTSAARHAVAAIAVFLMTVLV